MADKHDISKWLGVTSQQFNIIEAIFRLQRRGDTASPKAIIEEDASSRNTSKIQKSNLFSQLKKLHDKGFVKKLGDASYGVDFDRIKGSLDTAQASVDSEMNELKMVKEETEGYFNLLSSGEKRPQVKFFEYDEMYNKTADMVKTAHFCYLTGVFPRILYAHSPCMMNTPGARRYAGALWQRCIQEGELEVNYLSHFDVGYLFERLISTYKNPVPAYEEAKIVLGNLESLMGQNGKLNLYYVDTSYGLDMIIPHDEDINEFFLMVRNERNQGIGAVYVNSPELAIKFKDLFKRECERATDMKGPKGKQVIKKLMENLDKIYSGYKTKT
jgi:hypothetical protein